jgi:hypothetical protein
MICGKVTAKAGVRLSKKRPTMLRRGEFIGL